MSLKNRTKAQLRERPTKTPINARQIGALIRPLDGFESRLTTSKCGKLAQCSQVRPTATFSTWSHAGC